PYRAGADHQPGHPRRPEEHHRRPNRRLHGNVRAGAADGVRPDDRARPAVGRQRSDRDELRRLGGSGARLGDRGALLRHRRGARVARRPGATHHRHRRRGLRRPAGRPRAPQGPGRRGAARPAQLPPLPAAPLSGRHGRPRARADRQAGARHPAPPAELRVPDGRSHGRRLRDPAGRDRPRPGPVRLPDPRPGRRNELLRPGEHRAPRLWPERRGRRGGDPQPRAAVLRAGHARARRGAPARALIWAAGAKAVSLTATLGLTTARQGRVTVTPELQAPGHPEVYVIGDAAYLEHDGTPLPMMAPVAIQMADTAVANIARRLRDEAPLAFRYKDPGSLATIGRNAAVAYLGG